MYAIIKQGVYIQGVWFRPTLEEATELQTLLIEQDEDSYHEWKVCKVTDDGVEDWKVLSSLRKQSKGCYLKLWRNGNESPYYIIRDPEGTYSETQDKDSATLFQDIPEDLPKVYGTDIDYYEVEVWK
ncbi:hypothetical protein KUA24_80 [Vibrio phage HNL01]|nr:hypothetical protein KUA24_80 [Vibrio phage HNL01]